MKDARGWRIEPTFTLPEGFELWEQDDHFVDLYYGKKHVAVFTADATEGTILGVCQDFIQNGGEYACGL